MAATRLAVREAVRRSGGHGRLHIFGYSNGGALAVKYALDALEDERPGPAGTPGPHLPDDRHHGLRPLRRPRRVARLLPGLRQGGLARHHARVQSVQVQFVSRERGPPVLSADAGASRSQIARAAATGTISRLPPIHTFQSVVDYTVSTQAVVSSLYARLPANGSELTLFDINRAIRLGPLIDRSMETIIDRLLPAAPRAFRTTLVTNSDPFSPEAVERSTEAGGTTEAVQALGLAFPPGAFSLSHVALPFPVTDPLYGSQPDARESFGLRLGTLTPRGERGVLVVPLDALVRISSNPFYPYLERRVSEGIDRPPVQAR